MNEKIFPVVDGYKLTYSKWGRVMRGNGISGSIRTYPQSYYVATIDENGEILFEGLEANTKNINKLAVENLWINKKIPETKSNLSLGSNYFSLGGQLNKTFTLKDLFK